MDTRVEHSAEITVTTPGDGAVTDQMHREWRHTALQVITGYVAGLSPEDRDDLYRGWVDGRREEFLAGLHLDGLTQWQTTVVAQEFTRYMDDWHQAPA